MMFAAVAIFNIVIFQVVCRFMFVAENHFKKLYAVRKACKHVHICQLMRYADEQKRHSGRKNRIYYPYESRLFPSPADNVRNHDPQHANKRQFRPRLLKFVQHSLLRITHRCFLHPVSCIRFGSVPWTRSVIYYVHSYIYIR